MKKYDLNLTKTTAQLSGLTAATTLVRNPAAAPAVGIAGLTTTVVVKMTEDIAKGKKKRRK